VDDGAIVHSAEIASSHAELRSSSDVSPHLRSAGWSSSERSEEVDMYRHTETDPGQRRTAADYRFAVLTRDYRNLPPVSDDWWWERRSTRRRGRHDR
jgi:hypothetical protein